ncbi:DMT family transporter [Clostridium sp. DJ247]|uniref:DMT family transporter n=1 Tax=Clostridium sp. DJ247 TaxID=2726188 RepID=UPI0016278EF4|nr:DMT family transporter [Clostridium sp. DJ247]MBC2579670.1 DMT family transporter [Clostridium sp. DJ247]
MTKELKADLSLLGITVFWGMSFPIMSVALKSIPPFSFIAIRNTLAALILAAIFYKKFRNVDKKTIKAAVYIGVALLIGTIFQVVGIIYTTPSKSGFITGLNAVFVPVILALFFKQIPDLKTIIGIVLSILGLGIMSINGRMGINFGDFLTLLGAVAFAAQIILVDRYGGNVDAGVLTALELFVVGLFSFIPAIGVEKLQINFNAVIVGAILFTAIFSTAIAMCVQNAMQPYINPTHAAIIYLAEPVFGAFFSTLIGDRLTGRTLIGCILILSGTLIISVKVNFKRADIQEL